MIVKRKIRRRENHVLGKGFALKPQTQLLAYCAARTIAADGMAGGKALPACAGVTHHHHAIRMLFEGGDAMTEAHPHLRIMRGQPREQEIDQLRLLALHPVRMTRVPAQDR